MTRSLTLAITLFLTGCSAVQAATGSVDEPIDPIAVELLETRGALTESERRAEALQVEMLKTVEEQSDSRQGLQAELRSSQRAFRSARAETVTLSSQLRSTASEVATLQGQLQSLRARSISPEAHAQLRQQLQEERVRTTTLEAQRRAEGAHVATLVAQIRGTEATLAAVERDLQVAQGVAAAQRQQLRDGRARVRTLERTVDAMSADLQRLENLERRVHTLLRTKNQLEDQLAASCRREEALAGKFRQAERARAAMKVERDNAVARLGRLQSHSTSTAALQARLARAEQENAQLQREIRALKANQAKPAAATSNKRPSTQRPHTSRPTRGTSARRR